MLALKHQARGGRRGGETRDNETIHGCGSGGLGRDFIISQLGFPDIIFIASFSNHISDGFLLYLIRLCWQNRRSS